MRAVDPRQLLHSALGLEPGQTPFPWQEDLLALFEKGEIPSALDIPTGLGKTSVMAIWLLARLSCPKLPRRLVYVVDRRAVVDQATEVAERLREWIDRTSGVRQALGLQERSLPISTLRGRHVDNREWLGDPAAPAIIVGTVDMIGSRLLFQGYGVSRKMRPYHAGLLGVDTLVVLDEAHLVPPFEDLLRTIETDTALHPREESVRSLVPRFRLMTLSATGRELPAAAVRLTEHDRRHPIVCRRLNARKALRILNLSENEALADRLAQQAWDLCEQGQEPARILVFSDSRKVAQEAKKEFEKLLGKARKRSAGISADLELFVGGRRIFERERAKQRLEELGFLAGTRLKRASPVVLFATSAAEVGVDLDSDHMVCDLVAWERMVQRLGRVNRRGERDDTQVVVIVSHPSKEEQKLLDKQEQGRELNEKERQRLQDYGVRQACQRVLNELRRGDNGAPDASPDALLELRERAKTDTDLREALAAATTPEPLRPALTRASVDAWALTSLEKHPGRPPSVQPWLRGWVEDPPQTAVVWRRHLPVRPGGPPVNKREVEAFFEAARPHTSELLETETSQVAEWLRGCAKRILQGVDTEAGRATEEVLHEDDVAAFLLEPDGTLTKWLTLKELRDKEVEKRLGGAILVVDARLGGLDENGLLDEKVAGVPRTADDDQPWLDEGAVGFRIRRLDASAPATADPNWRERFRFAAEISAEGEPISWLLVEKWRGDAATEEDRSAGPPQLLEEHAKQAGMRARELARALCLPPECENALALAACLHDEGKRAPRWQRAFNAPGDGVYAKTLGPINYSRLDGYRHELGSLLRIQHDHRLQELPADLRDLVLHLVVAHHGFARPAIGLSGCEDAPPSMLEEEACKIALRFARLNARWGPFGLAWWESLLRAADQQASRENEERGTSRGGA